MSPSDRNLDGRAAAVTMCLDDCGSPVEPGRMRCDGCLEAARIAEQERQPGQAIKPSDIAAIRARQG